MQVSYSSSFCRLPRPNSQDALDEADEARDAFREADEAHADVTSEAFSEQPQTLAMPGEPGATGAKAVKL